MFSIIYLRFQRKAEYGAIYEWIFFRSPALCYLESTASIVYVVYAFELFHLSTVARLFQSLLQGTRAASCTASCLGAFGILGKMAEVSEEGPFILLASAGGSYADGVVSFSAYPH